MSPSFFYAYFYPWKWSQVSLLFSHMNVLYATFWKSWRDFSLYGVWGAIYLINHMPSHTTDGFIFTWEHGKGQRSRNAGTWGWWGMTVVWRQQERQGLLLPLWPLVLCDLFRSQSWRQSSWLPSLRICASCCGEPTGNGASSVGQRGSWCQARQVSGQRREGPNTIKAEKWQMRDTYSFHLFCFQPQTCVK